MRPNKKTFLLSLLFGLSLVLTANAEIKVGDSFPDLNTYQIEGKLPESLKDKVVMVDFWASWCVPCAESFPAMDELQKKYASQGLIIIAVSVDEKKADMEKFVKDHQVSFAIVRDARQKLVEKADISTMPGSFVIDRRGKVAFVHSGFHGSDTKKQYEHEIESLLKQNQK